MSTLTAAQTSLAVHLKENIYITTEKVTPAGAKMMLSGTLTYVSEDECKWYVQESEEKTMFRNYANNGLPWLSTAKKSFASALKKMTKGNENIDHIKFRIYAHELN